MELNARRFAAAEQFAYETSPGVFASGSKMENAVGVLESVQSSLALSKWPQLAALLDRRDAYVSRGWDH